jgi:hypothetical protein
VAAQLVRGYRILSPRFHRGVVVVVAATRIDNEL